jgi:membrane-bound metal-dependent hydrolase YbcI (DUF457 family)
MLPPGHVAAGFMTSLAVLSIGKPNISPEQQLILLGLGTFFAFAPDLDMFMAFVEAKAFNFGKKNVIHRNYLTHVPMLWFLAGLTVYLGSESTFGQYLGLLIWFGSWSHFILDSIQPYGIRWLWPISKRFFAIRDAGVARQIKADGFIAYWWKMLQDYPKSAPLTFYLELTAIFAGVLTFLFTYPSFI